MKSIVFALALVAIAAAIPVDKEIVKILRSDVVQDPLGPYKFNVETENGIIRNEQGELKELLDEDNKPRQVVVVRGTYSYPREDGTLETVNYIADEAGYRAEGPSIPKEPVVSRR